MLAFFESIANAIQAVFEFLQHIFEGFIRMVQYIGIAVQTVGTIIAKIPPDLAVIASGFIAVSVVYLIIGREGS